MKFFIKSFFSKCDQIRCFLRVWSHLLEEPLMENFIFCAVLIAGGSGSGKANALLNLINRKQNIDKIILYAKDPYEAKYQLLVNKRERTGLKYLNDTKAFIQYSNDTDDIYKNI